MFIKGKLIVDDESYNILRYESGRYQNVTKNGMAYTNVITNPYIIEIETTSETNLFAWAASKAIMKPVKIVLSHPSEMERPRTIQLYDTLCVGYDCYFNAIDNNPMITRLVLSPAIVVENGEPIMEQSWKVTDLSQQNNNGQVQQRNNVENNENAIELLVKKLEGPFTEDGNKKVEELIKGNTYLYKVIEYSVSDDDKLTNTQWSVELNNDGKLKQLKQSNAFVKDGVICYKYTPEEAEKIRIYAWCQVASKDVSVEVPVVSFPMVIARSARRAGNCYGTKGEELTKEDITNLNIKYPDEKDILKQKLENGFEDLGIKYDENRPESVESYKEEKASRVKYALDYIEEYNLNPDISLFSIMKNDLDDYATGDLEDNLYKMIDFFKQNGSTNNRYEDKRLTKAIAENQVTKDFIDGFFSLLQKELDKKFNALNKLRVKDSERQFVKSEYDESKNGNPEILGIKGVQSLPSFKYDEWFSGLGISVHDTQAFNVVLTDFNINNEQYEGKILLEIFDHFGLDSPDILKDYLRKMKVFICWYMLQHLRGYKPFITYIPIQYNFKGSLNENNLKIELDENF